MAETHPPGPVLFLPQRRPEAVAVPPRMGLPPAPILVRVASKLLACLPSGGPPHQSQPLDCATLRRPLARVGFMGARPVILNGLKFPFDPGGLYSLGAHSRPASPTPTTTLHLLRCGLPRAFNLVYVSYAAVGPWLGFHP